MRNEEAVIENLITDLAKQDYAGQMKIYFVDDHSNDATFEKVKSLIEKNGLSNAMLLQSPNESKKASIDFAIRESNGEFIITTDADCRVGTQWVSSFVNVAETSSAKFFSGPVALKGGATLLEKMQSLEMIGLTGIAAASFAQHQPMMCNGANMAYRREAYLQVNGFAGSRFSSGDDTQLMRKIADENPSNLLFVKNGNAIVVSDPQSTINSFYEQRRRWATKIPFTLSPITVIVAIIAWLVHAGLFLSLIATIFGILSWKILLVCAISKTLPELFFLSRVSSFLKMPVNNFLVILLQPLYWFYIFIIGLLVPFSGYEWKGRRVV